jgi:hypothetical protein
VYRDYQEYSQICLKVIGKNKLEGGDTESRSFPIKEGKVTKYVEDFSAL